MERSHLESLILAISQGEIIPAAIFSKMSLAKLLKKAASLTTGIKYYSLDKDNYTKFQPYKQLLISSAKILAGLRAFGLQPQEKVILQLSTPDYWLSSFWACILGGFVPVPLSVELTSDRSKLAVVCELDCQLIITEKSLFSSIQDLLSTQQVAHPAIATVEDLATHSPDQNFYQGNLDDLALLLLTSGSTGKPKGVMLSQRNILASVYGMATVNQLSKDDITLNWMPLEHVASLVMFHLTEVYLGCDQIQVASELVLQNPLTWLDLIARDRASVTWSPNFGYNLVTQKFAQASQHHNWDLSCVRWMGNGAEAVVSKTTRDFLAALEPYQLKPNVVSPGYGMSETCSGISHSQSFGLEVNSEQTGSTVSVGKPIPGISLRIVDEQNLVLTETQVGELQVKGLTVTSGYYQRPNLNQEIFTPDGWFKTGDLGFISEGKLTITGRQKEVIILNGANYYNHEIEAVVNDLAGVSVSFTAACGVKDQQEQEQLAVFFHPQTSTPDFIRNLISQIRKTLFQKLRVVPYYLIPVGKANIPKTAIGKIQRSKLVRQFESGEFAQVIAQIADLESDRTLSTQELPTNQVEKFLVEIWQEVLQLKIISTQDNFFELGGNSILLMELLSKLQTKFPQLDTTSLFQYPTIAALANSLTSLKQRFQIDNIQQAQARGKARRDATKIKDIAIIGMACRFPGANNLKEFWHNLSQGIESIEFFEPQEAIALGVDLALAHDPNYVLASPVLEGIEDFDAEFWGYTPKEAKLLDPQQRLFLECAWEGLEDAGYNSWEYPGAISLYAGSGANTYFSNHIYPYTASSEISGSLKPLNLSSMFGFQATVANDKDYLATRTAYKLNLKGSSITVQTACSTSLVAVHLACQSIRSGECDLALAGGISLQTPQKMGYLYQEGMILSPDGHCRAFDNQAAGTIFGSGAGVVVLKALEQAIADRDRIYGVIKGSAVNNDGSSKVGYLAPNVEGQSRVIAQALACADVDPTTINYVEAHGTGTKLGDPIEIAALTQAWQAYQDRSESNRMPKIKQSCAIGSVKTNVGHLQMASGIVGLIKTTLALYHQQIPASLNFQEPNSQIDFANSYFFVNTELQPWKISNYPRRAGVNSLGIGGTNCHLILEEFAGYASSNHQEQPSLPAYLLPLSAKTPQALQALLVNYQRFLLKNPEASLADICHTASNRVHFGDRLAVVAHDRADLLAKLTVQLQDLDASSRRYQPGKIAFLFTGQGSQYLGMGRELYQLESVFKSVVDNCAQILEPYLEQPLLAIIFDQSETNQQSSLIDQTKFTQPTIFAIEYALARLWMSWGVNPDFVIGHSLGEYVAAAIAGVFSLEDALKLLSARGKLMGALPKCGSMLAVFVNKEKIEHVLVEQGLAEFISIAADNGEHLVVSGQTEKILKLVRHLDCLGIKHQVLRQDLAFHSSLMQPMIAEFRAIAESINYYPPKIPLVSNLTGELASQQIATSDYWLDQIIKPVEFAAGIRCLAEQEVQIYLEIGAKPTLTAIAQTIFDRDSNSSIFLPTLNPKVNDWQQILTSLKELYLQGLQIDWLQVRKIYAGKQISLPHYPFQRQRYWYELPSQNGRTRFNQRQDQKISYLHPLLHKLVNSPLRQQIYSSQLNSQNSYWFEDHQLVDRLVFPGTAYLEMALAAGNNYLKTQSLQLQSLQLQNVSFERSLYLPETGNLEIQLILEPQPHQDLEKKLAYWSIHSLDSASTDQNNSWQLHAQGEVSKLFDVDKSRQTPDLKDLQKQFIKSSSSGNVSFFYQKLAQKGIKYGVSFQGIQQLWTNEQEALAQICLPNNDLAPDQSNYLLHPALLDACCQTIFAALPKDLQVNTYIPVGLDNLTLEKTSPSKVWSYLQLREIQHLEWIVADLWLYSDRGELVASITGLRSQLVKLPNPSTLEPDKSLNHDWFYRIIWQESKSLPLKKFESPGSWLILGDRLGVANQLAGLLKKQAQQCYLIPALSYGETNTLDWDQLVKQIAQQEFPLRGVIYFADFVAIALEKIIPQECQTNLELMQALLRQDLSELPSFWYVTRNTQAVNQHQTTKFPSKINQAEIRQAALWGMGKAITIEYPELTYLGIDIESRYSPQDAESIYQALTNSQPESLAFRDQQVYVNRLQCYQLQQPPSNQAQNQQLVIAEPGNLDSLQWQPTIRKQPQANQIEIDVKVTGLNFRDLLIALNLYLEANQSLGLECAGVVTAVGEQVEDFQIGDSVIAITGASFRQYVTVDSRLAVLKPEEMTLAEAVTIPVTFLTAYYTLVKVARLQPHEKVLIHSAAGGVGLAAVAIAKYLGAEIYATASVGKWKLLKALGIKHIMNSRDLEFAEQIRKLTQGQGVDVVLNSLSGDFISQSLAVLKPRGRFLEIGKQGIWSNEQVRDSKPQVVYSVVDLWQITQQKPELIQQMLQELMALSQTQTLQPLPYQKFTQANTVQAFRHMQQAQHQGKIVIEQICSSRDYRGTYLITGGLGAIGLQVARWLADSGVEHLVLLGRNPVKPEYQQVLEKLRSQLPVTILYQDVSNYDLLLNNWQKIRSNLPELKGIIHCAGTINDATLAQQTWQKFNEVMRAKVQGAWNLHQLTQELQLDLDRFILFSSASSLLGSVGQANYCAANSCLDALAHHRLALGLPALALNWGVWQDTEMAKSLDLLDNLKNQGIKSISSEDAINYLETLFNQDIAQVGIVPIDWNQWQHANLIKPFYQQVIKEHQSQERASNSQQQAAKQLSLRQQLEQLTNNREPERLRSLRVELITYQISKLVAQILGIQDIDHIDIELGFRELGLDSLGTVELRNKLQFGYELKLSATVIFDYPNVRAIAIYLYSLLFPTNQNSNSQDDLDKQNELNQIAQLSEAEAEAALLVELNNLNLECE